MIHDLRWLVKDGERVLQYNSDPAGDNRDWHDVLDYYPAVQPKVEITRAQFWEAVEGVLQDWEGNHMTAVTNAAKLIAAKLGLGGDP